jgi:eukaryotic-like serine/threonine-protein kinase
MSLPSRTCLGPYGIQSAIGADGMGEVYRARDTQWKGDVALTSLPSDLGLDAERPARFDREAQARLTAR